MIDTVTLFAVLCSVASAADCQDGVCNDATSLVQMQQKVTHGSQREPVAEAEPDPATVYRHQNYPSILDMTDAQVLSMRQTQKELGEDEFHLGHADGEEAQAMPELKAATCFMEGVKNDHELNQMVQSSEKLKEVQKAIAANLNAAYQYMHDKEVKPFLDKALAKLMPKCLPGQDASLMQTNGEWDKDDAEAGSELGVFSSFDKIIAHVKPSQATKEALRAQDEVWEDGYHHLGDTRREVLDGYHAPFGVYQQAVTTSDDAQQALRHVGKYGPNGWQPGQDYEGVTDSSVSRSVAEDKKAQLVRKALADLRASRKDDSKN